MNDDNNNDLKNHGFFENVYGTLFYPGETFESLKQNPPIVQAVGIVVVISILNLFVNSVVPVTQAPAAFTISIIGQAFSGLFKWVVFAAFLELIALIFKHGGRIKIFLTLSAFALLPWIFIGPAFLLKTGGTIFSLIGIILGFVVWGWATALTVFAGMKAYDLSPRRGILLFVIPVFGGVIFFNWIIGFFSTLAQILNV